MKQDVAVLCVYLLFLVNCGGLEATVKKQEVENKVEGPQHTTLINKDVAIAIAKEAYINDHGALNVRGIVACEMAEEWRIMFELKTPNLDGEIVEYALAKHRGTVLKTRKISLAVISEGESIEELSSFVGKEEATIISEKDAATAYQSLERYNIIVCELTAAWRIIYELKDTGLNGGGPEYVIDKKTGNILDKKYFQ